MNSFKEKALIQRLMLLRSYVYRTNVSKHELKRNLNGIHMCLKRKSLENYVFYINSSEWQLHILIENQQWILNRS